MPSNRQKRSVKHRQRSRKRKIDGVKKTKSKKIMNNASLWGDDEEQIIVYNDDDCRKQIDQLQKKIQEKDKTIQNLNEKLEQINDELSDYNEQLEKIVKQYFNLETENKDLKEKLNDCRYQLQNLDTTNRNTTDINSREQINLLKTKISELERDIITKQTKITELEAEIIKINNITEKIKEKLGKMNQEKQDLLNINIVLEKKIEDLLNANKVLEKKIDDLNIENNDLNTENARKEKEIERLDLIRMELKYQLETKETPPSGSEYDLKSNMKTLPSSVSPEPDLKAPPSPISSVSKYELISPSPIISGNYINYTPPTPSISSTPSAPLSTSLIPRRLTNIKIPIEIPFFDGQPFFSTSAPSNAILNDAYEAVQHIVSSLNNQEKDIVGDIVTLKDVFLSTIINRDQCEAVFQNIIENSDTIRENCVWLLKIIFFIVWFGNCEQPKFVVDKKLFKFDYNLNTNNVLKHIKILCGKTLFTRREFPKILLAINIIIEFFENQVELLQSDYGQFLTLFKYIFSEPIGFSKLQYYQTTNKVRTNVDYYNDANIKIEKYNTLIKRILTIDFTIPDSGRLYLHKTKRKSIRKSRRKSRRKSVRKSRRKSIRKSVRKSVRKSIRKSVRKSRRKSRRKSIRKSVRKSIRKSRRKSRRKSVRKSRRKSIRKSRCKSSRKSVYNSRHK